MVLVKYAYIYQAVYPWNTPKSLKEMKWDDSTLLGGTYTAWSTSLNKYSLFAALILIKCVRASIHTSNYVDCIQESLVHVSKRHVAVRALCTRPVRVPGVWMLRATRCFCGCTNYTMPLTRIHHRTICTECQLIGFGNCTRTAPTGPCFIYRHTWPQTCCENHPEILRYISYTLPVLPACLPSFRSLVGFFYNSAYLRARYQALLSFALLSIFEANFLHKWKLLDSYQFALLSSNFPGKYIQDE